MACVNGKKGVNRKVASELTGDRWVDSPGICGCMPKESRCRCESADVFEFDGVSGDLRGGHEAREKRQVTEEINAKFNTYNNSILINIKPG